jgi:hypothetical protein
MPPKGTESAMTERSGILRKLFLICEANLIVRRTLAILSVHWSQASILNFYLHQDAS